MGRLADPEEKRRGADLHENPSPGAGFADSLILRSRGSNNNQVVEATSEQVVRVFENVVNEPEVPEIQVYPSRPKVVDPS